MIKVTLISHMGSDLTVVNAARVSFAKHTDKLLAKDRNLIRYLAAHNHFTPFTHPQLAFLIRAPIFVARQCFKSKVGLTENEVSRRYVDASPEFYDPGNWRTRAEDKKQGSGPGIALNPGIYIWYKEAVEACQFAYDNMIAVGVAPEQARMVLPQSMMTEWYWTGSLAAFARFFNLRIQADAQQETGYVAKAIGGWCESIFPVSWPALTAAKTPTTDGA